MPQAKCPQPVFSGMDGYLCPKCGIAWDRNEEKPACNFEKRAPTFFYRKAR